MPQHVKVASQCSLANLPGFPLASVVCKLMYSPCHNRCATTLKPPSFENSCARVLPFRFRSFCCRDLFVVPPIVQRLVHSFRSWLWYDRLPSRFEKCVKYRNSRTEATETDTGWLAGIQRSRRRKPHHNYKAIWITTLGKSICRTVSAVEVVLLAIR